MTSLRETLLAEPARFSFDAAVGLVRRAAGPASPVEPVRYRAPSGLAFVAAEVLAIRPEGGRYGVVTGLLGMTGPGGVLPRPYTELVSGEQRRRSPALAAMLDLLAQRPMAQFADAGAKYRPHRAAERVAGQTAEAAAISLDGLRGALLALTGYAISATTGRLPVEADTLLFYAGAFAARPRSAEWLGSILSDWLGQTVEIEQFDGAWLRIDRDQVSALPGPGRTGRYHQLGVDAVAGAQAWDVQSRIRLRIGALGLAAFRALSPGGTLLGRLNAFAAAYLDGAVAFSVNPVLRAACVPRPRLGSADPCHLGWDAWLPVASGRTGDAAEAVFAAEPGDRVSASAEVAI